MPKGDRRKLSDDVVREIIHLYQTTQLSLPSIAEVAGCNHATIWRLLKRRKVPKRPRRCAEEGCGKPAMGIKARRCEYHTLVRFAFLQREWARDNCGYKTTRYEEDGWHDRPDGGNALIVKWKPRKSGYAGPVVMQAVKEDSW